MQIAQRISAIEDRARSLNLTLGRVCNLAGVDYSTVSRWRNGKCSPTLSKLEEVFEALDDQLATLEKQMRKRLSSSRPAA